MYRLQLVNTARMRRQAADMASKFAVQLRSVARSGIALGAPALLSRIHGSKRHGKQTDVLRRPHKRLHSL